MLQHHDVGQLRVRHAEASESCKSPILNAGNVNPGGSFSIAMWVMLRPGQRNSAYLLSKQRPFFVTNSFDVAAFQVYWDSVAQRLAVSTNATRKGAVDWRRSTTPVHRQPRERRVAPGDCGHRRARAGQVMSSSDERRKRIARHVAADRVLSQGHY
ncbi:MAG UNVERIFIED_CONTAM: hypothetical protein LVT10_01270 [Anaerolineae bacterium]|jgi:hypothetical protein